MPPRKKTNDNYAHSERTLTPEERAIVERINTEDGDWGPISEEEMVDFSLSEDPFKLPKEAAEKQKKQEYAFRWAERKPERIDELKHAPGPFAWRVCNMSTTPFLGKYIDPIIGGVLRMDQILMYKPYRMYAMAQQTKLDRANAQLNAGDISKKNGYQDQDRGVEYMSGPQHRITGSDEVMADEATLDSSSDDSDFGDIITEE